MGDDKEDARQPSSGTIIRARNGDVLRYDSTGLVMVLSDTVIADIGQRLSEQGHSTQERQWIDPLILGDVDAWDLRCCGEWIVFNANLPGAQGARKFRRLAKAEDSDFEPSIFADGAGPLRGLFSIGGPRRATGFDTSLEYPWHVLAPADDLGAVGHAGDEHATQKSTLETLREATRDAALGDILAKRQHQSHRAMSLFVTRCETDSSASIQELAQGAAYANLMVAIDSLKAAAERLDRPATLYGLGFEFSLEDIRSDATDYRDGVFGLLGQLTADIAHRGLRCPPILAVFDCGTHFINDSPVLRAQWELAWQGPDHGLFYSAPGYMFKQDTYGRPDSEALWQMAEMDACALEALRADDGWTCPVFLLAEKEPDPKRIRLRARALENLVLDPVDPFGSGPSCGFSLRGTSNDPQIIDVAIAEDDPQDVILTLDVPAEGEKIEVLYAFGQSPARNGTDYPKVCGALRDKWSFDSKTGTRLHRWALPAALPLW